MRAMTPVNLSADLQQAIYDEFCYCDIIYKGIDG